MNAREGRNLFVLANAFKEGDLAVGGTTDDRLRAEARRELLALSRSARSGARCSSRTESRPRSSDRAIGVSTTTWTR